VLCVQDEYEEGQAKDLSVVFISSPHYPTDPNKKAIGREPMKPLRSKKPEILEYRETDPAAAGSREPLG
jgi:hypothetical protein